MLTFKFKKNRKQKKNEILDFSGLYTIFVIISEILFILLFILFYYLCYYR